MTKTKDYLIVVLDASNQTITGGLIRSSGNADDIYNKVQKNYDVHSETEWLTFELTDSRRANLKESLKAILKKL